MKPFNRELAEAGHPIEFAKPENWEGCSDLRFEKYVERAHKGCPVSVSYVNRAGSILVRAFVESDFVMAPKKKKIWVRAYRDNYNYICISWQPYNNPKWTDSYRYISDPAEVEVDNE